MPVYTMTSSDKIFDGLFYDVAHLEGCKRKGHGSMSAAVNLDEGHATQKLCARRVTRRRYVTISMKFVAFRLSMWTQWTWENVIVAAAAHVRFANLCFMMLLLMPLSTLVVDRYAGDVVLLCLQLFAWFGGNFSTLRHFECLDEVQILCFQHILSRASHWARCTLVYHLTNL